MKENPNPSIPEFQQAFKGDNQLKFSGDFIRLMNQEGFILEATQVGGVEVNNVAMPSQVEILYKQFKERKELLKNKKIQDLVSKYGGEQHLQLPEEVREAMKAELMEHAEMARLGKAAENQEAKSFEVKGILGIKSKYEEDVYVNGHSSVWGSYWHPHFGWAYRCCYSFDRNSKCKGEDGKKETIKKEYDYELRIKRQKEEEERRLVEETNRKYLKTE